MRGEEDFQFERHGKKRSAETAGEMARLLARYSSPVRENQSLEPFLKA
jgi:hypothetical protein